MPSAVVGILIALHILGALATSRFLIIDIQDGIDQGHFRRWEGALVFAVIFVSIFWPVVAAFLLAIGAVWGIGWLYMKIMFPRGINTKTAKANKIKAREAEIAALAEANGLPAHVGQVLPYGIAATYFAEQAAQVEQTKGQDWKAGVSSRPTEPPALTGALMVPRKSGRKVSGHDWDYEYDDFLQTIAAAGAVRDTDWAAIHADHQKLRQDAEDCTSFTDRQVGYGGGLR